MSLEFKCLATVLLLAVSTACADEPDIDDAIDLDGNEIYDPSLDHPEDYLLSHKLPHPTAEQLQMPVAITVHGFSASTWEWDEFCGWCSDRDKVLTSQLLLGGHGMTYEVFKKSTWSDWQQPIIREYRRLDSLGYTNISLIGSSTGGTLILEVMASGKLSAYQRPSHVFMIDPIIIPSNKLLSLIGFVGPVIGYTQTSLDEAENGHYYKYRPHEALKQLVALVDQSRKDLEDGIRFPDGVSLSVYKSLHDSSADPVSALLIYKGVSTSLGKPNVTLVESDLHVFTYLKGRNSYSENDKLLQIQTFLEIESLLTGH
jgi:carboxylesterase